MQPHHKIADFRTQKNLTLQALAERVGTTKSQIDKLEKGERRLTVAWLQKIAGALEVPVSEFFDPRGAAADGRGGMGLSQPAPVLADPALSTYEAPPPGPPLREALPVLHGADAPLPVQGRGDPLTDMLVQVDKPSSYLPRPPLLAGVGDAYGVYMVGDGMEPRYFAGDLLYVDPSRPLTKGCFVLLIFHDDTALVRRLVRRNDGGTLLVQQTGRNREDCIPLSDLRAVHRIVGSVEQGAGLVG